LAVEGLLQDEREHHDEDRDREQRGRGVSITSTGAYARRRWTGLSPVGRVSNARPMSRAVVVSA